jgi:hypothetical protein
MSFEGRRGESQAEAILHVHVASGTCSYWPPDRLVHVSGIVDRMLVS